MKKLVSICMAMLLCFTLAACGGASGRADAALVGKYVAVTGTAFGVTLSGEDMSGLTMTLEKSGKVSIAVEGTTATGRWVNDDSTITLTVEKTKMVGQLGEDTITFENFLEEQIGASMDVTFAKEGTDAAKPENFLPDEEKALLGDWVGVSVADALDEDASGEVAPTAMEATLREDHTAVIRYKGVEIANPSWSLISDMVSFDGDVDGGAKLYGEVKDGALVITYSSDEDYYEFTMEAAP